MNKILVRCPFSICTFLVDTSDWKGERIYTATQNVNCPTCKTRIVKGKKLEVVPLDISQVQLMDAKEKSDTEAFTRKIIATVAYTDMTRLDNSDERFCDKCRGKPDDKGTTIDWWYHDKDCFFMQVRQFAESRGITPADL